MCTFVAYKGTLIQVTAYAWQTVDLNWLSSNDMINGKISLLIYILFVDAASCQYVKFDKHIFPDYC